MQSRSNEQDPVELQDFADMDRVRNAFKPRQAYEPLLAQDNRDDEDGSDCDEDEAAVEDFPFSWVEYSIFLLLGVAMLWAW